MEKITVQWLGHSCFKLTFGDWNCVIDPYENGSVNGLSDLQISAIEVFCSHDHHDHNAAHLVKQARIFAPSPKIKKIDSYHDDANGDKRGKNTIHVFEYNGIKIAHFGDLGHILTYEQCKEIGDIDVALLPVGGFYTISPQEAKEVAAQVNAKTIIPMHYKTEKFGFDVIAHIDEFTSLFDDVLYTNTSELEIYKNNHKQVVVLKPYFEK